MEGSSSATSLSSAGFVSKLPRLSQGAAPKASQLRLNEDDCGGIAAERARGTRCGPGDMEADDSTEACPPQADDDDAVRVVIRLRPLSQQELSEANSPPCVTLRDDRTLVLADPARLDPYVTSFDRVLGGDSTQLDAFAAVGRSLVENCLAGFNSSIFAYGQTGSGKTYTMLGDPARCEGGALSPACGLIPRVFEALFAAVAEREAGRGGRAAPHHSVKCSFLEIYNEEVTDLLAPGASGLTIRDGDAKRGVYVQGLSEVEVFNADDVLAVLSRGSANRRVAATRMNERSSRSHSVFTATIHARESSVATGGGATVRYAKLNLVDLAGSERVGRSGATGEQLAEAKSINRSLAVLGRVIQALVDRQRPGSAQHVPYRDSRLTFLLQDSLGGNSRTCVVANVTAAPASAAETYSTLAFAAGAKKLTCRAVVNEEPEGGGGGRALQLENAALRRRVAELEEQRDAAAAEGGQERRERKKERAAAEGAQAAAESEAAALRAQLCQARELFDQNNAAITGMRAEQGVLRRELAEAKAAAARVTEEAVQLRSDNCALSNDLERMGDEQERLQLERDRLRDGVEAAAAAARAAEERRRGLSAEHDRAAAELAGARTEAQAARAGAAADAARLNADLAEAQLAHTAAAAALEEARREVARLRREAREEAAAAAAREERLRREVEALRSQASEVGAELEGLRHQVKEGASCAAKHKRLAGEIGRLIEWAQCAGSQPPAGVAAFAGSGAAGKSSPAALAAPRAARPSLGGINGPLRPQGARHAPGVARSSRENK